MKLARLLCIIAPHGKPEKEKKRIQIMKAMVKIVFKVFGVLIFLAGGIWFLQGINILPGSYMTGDPQWAINGSIAMLIGVGLFWFANRGKKLG
jgi:hypothetical protein